jgi:hypothetical protein
MDQLLIDSSSIDIDAFTRKEYNRHLITSQVYFKAPLHYGRNCSKNRKKYSAFLQPELNVIFAIVLNTA